MFANAVNQAYTVTNSYHQQMTATYIPVYEKIGLFSNLKEREGINLEHYLLAGHEN